MDTLLPDCQQSVEKISRVLGHNLLGQPEAENSKTEEDNVSIVGVGRGEAPVPQPRRYATIGRRKQRPETGTVSPAPLIQSILTKPSVNLCELRFFFFSSFLYLVLYYRLTKSLENDSLMEYS